MNATDRAMRRKHTTDTDPLDERGSPRDGAVFYASLAQWNTLTKQFSRSAPWSAATSIFSLPAPAPNAAVAGQDNAGAEVASGLSNEGRIIINGEPYAHGNSYVYVQGARPGVDGLYLIKTAEHIYSRQGYVTWLDVVPMMGGGGTTGGQAIQTTQTPSAAGVQGLPGSPSGPNLSGQLTVQQQAAIDNALASGNTELAQQLLQAQGLDLSQITTVPAVPQTLIDAKSGLPVTIPPSTFDAMPVKGN